MVINGGLEVTRKAARLRTLFRIANKSFFFGYNLLPLVIKFLDLEGWVVGAVRRATQKVIGKIAVLNLL